MAQSQSVSEFVPVWTLGDRLTKARKGAGLDQVDIAELLGVSRKSVMRYEADETMPNRAVRLAWAMATGVSPAWIETGTTPPDQGVSQGVSPTAWHSLPLPTSYQQPLSAAA